MRDVLEFVTERGFAVDELATAAINGAGPTPGGPDGTVSQRSMVEVTLQVHGRGQLNELAAGLSEMPAVQAVVAEDVHTTGE